MKLLSVKLKWNWISETVKPAYSDAEVDISIPGPDPFYNVTTAPRTGYQASYAIAEPTTTPFWLSLWSPTQAINRTGEGE